ncbi:MAG: asparagine synthase-related protein [Candidatus Acidiferrales bacterium]|jgi:asparagine synthase (glutamine-hydrolysing)
MSGICGICEPGRELDSSIPTAMIGALALPGETERVVRGGRSAAFGVARRWTFQQLASVDGLLVAADADLLDHAALANELRVPATELASLSSAEWIARLYAKHGMGFLGLLHGGFSLALWDERAQRLFMAIDRMGIKSLYLRREGERLLFASRIGAIRAAQKAPFEVDPAAIIQFLLFSAVPAPMAIDRGAEKLRPGTCVVFESGSLTEHQYWDLEYPESGNRSVSDWARELRDGMRGAVHRHLENREAAQTGCYLSGGTDSSSVVAFASEKNHPAQSFSIAFEEAGFSEIQFARTTAATFKTHHHEKFLTPQDAAGALDRIIAYYDEPFANSSAIGSYYCAQLARDAGVNTLLAGDGGDELFGGNERYSTDKRFSLYHEIPAWLRRGLIEPLVGLLPENDGKLSLPRRYVRRANMPNPRRILSYGLFLSWPPEEIFEDGFLQQAGVDHWLAIPEEHFRRARTTSELNRILYLDVKMTLADNDLRKVSGTAELAGVNVRYPLLDDRLAELSGRIPAALKLKGFEKRYIFKQAMKDILPHKVLYKKKHGFGVPLAQWLLQEPRMREKMQDVMHDPRTRQRGYFRAEFFDRLMSLHGQQPDFYGEIVWYLLALELWHRWHLEHRHGTVYAI